MIEYLRLAFGTAVVLAPGAAVARALGRRSLAHTFAWALAALFVAWAVVFTVHSDIRLAGGLLALVWVGAVVLGHRFRRAAGSHAESGSKLCRVAVWAGGVVLGWLLWSVEGPVTGDGPFHEGRVRKLVSLGNLHLRTLDEFKDGGLHPGYAFPLWHAFLAVIAWVAQLDPSIVVQREPSVLTPIVCVLVWESGTVIFGSAFAGLSVLVSSVALFVFAAGYGGSFDNLTLPATAGRQLLVPVALVLLFGWFERRDRVALAGAAVTFGALGLIHATYAVFLLLPLAGYALMRLSEWKTSAVGLAAAIVPTGLAALWLKPIADETVSRTTGLQELVQFRSQLVIENLHHFRVAPQVFGRSGSIAVVSLLVLPVTALARRSRWSAFALGGSLVVLIVMEVSWLFVQFSNVVSLSQSHRAPGFAPAPFVFAGAAALLARSWLVLPASLAAGIAAQLQWPGDFNYVLMHGGPASATWIALFGGLAALVAAAVFLRRYEPRERHALGFAAVVLFTLPVFVHGFVRWRPQTPVDPLALSPRLIHNLRTKVPKGAIVIAPVETSYRVVAEAPVYVVAVPPPHAANTRANDPYGRARAVRHWVATNDPAVPRRYGATWAIRAGRLYRLPG